MAQEKTTYNGWRNYETWVFKLWIDNDRTSYEYWREIVSDVKETVKASEYLTKEEEEEVKELENLLKNWIEENNPLIDQPCLYADLMNAAINEIDFKEIAESLIKETI